MGQEFRVFRRRLPVWLLTLTTASVLAQSPSPQPAASAAQDADAWDVTRARGQTRTIDFTTDQGTWMSVDVSPDGTWIVFDLLGHVYRMPRAGGDAQCLTQDTGVALNFHPRISPDGTLIAFVSDRKGQNNLWVMNADGSSPRAVFTSAEVRVFEPAWTPDGQYVIVRRQEMKRGGTTGLWMYHRDGGEGVELVGRDERGAAWPAVSPDGEYLYFHAQDGDSGASGHRDVLKGGYQIRRLELATGDRAAITAGVAAQQNRGSSGGGLAPELSPDGRYLAFARRIPDGTISHKGHKFGPRTALWLRDLHTGRERIVMDPIEVDMAEGMKVWRLLPGYGWTADSRTIVISQGGRIRELDVASGQVSTVAFTARVQRPISEMAYKPLEIPDGPFRVKFARWHTASPDGGTLAFQAVGRIWTLAPPDGTPARLTPETFEPFEFSPAWSRDGRWVAFTTWDEQEGGALWKIPAGGGTPERLTPEPGEFVNPVWSPDGEFLIVSRGAGETFRGRPLNTNPWYELVRVPAAGGTPTAIALVNDVASRRQIVQASFGPEGRVFYAEPGEERQDGDEEPIVDLVSVTIDGKDERRHLRFPYTDEIVPSPDGKWVAFEEGDNLYLTPLPYQGTGGDPVRIDKRKGKLPVTQISTEGGLFPRWRDDTTLEYGSGPRHHVYHVDTKQTDTTEIRLDVPRRVPSGSIALTGARLITLETDQVIDRGTIVVKGARVTCVGDCSTDGVDRVVDVAGRTIVPGFVDMHAHHYREHRGLIPSRSAETAIYLAYGVTTNLDNSMWSQNVFPSAELIEAGLMIGPRTYSTGDPLYRGDGPRQNEISSYEVADQNVARLQSWGAVSIKQYLQPQRDQRQWVTDAARKRGLMVTAEGDSLEYNVGMMLDGQTGFEHPMSYMPLYADAAKFFGQAKAVYSPTFIVGGPGAWNEEFFFQESETWKDEKMRRFLPWRQLVPHARRRMLRPPTDYSFPLVAQGLADIIAEGGYGAIGSHGQQHGIGSHWEIWMAAEALGPRGALELATVHGAHFLGASKELGTLATGKLADLVVLNSNPLDDIRNTADIQYVMKGGVLYEASTLDEIWPEARPFGDYSWVDPEVWRTDDRPTDYFDKPPTTSSGSVRR